MRFNIDEVVVVVGIDIDIVVVVIVIVVGKQHEYTCQDFVLKILFVFNQLMQQNITSPGDITIIIIIRTRDYFIFMRFIYI